MGNIIEEIERIEDAKSAINGAIIQSGGPAGEEDDLIDTYAERIRAIPQAVLSNLDVGITGGDDYYIKSIKQEDGKIEATTGGIVSASKSGLAPKIGTTNDAATIATQTSELVLTSDGSITVWKKLPANAFLNNQVTLTAKSDNVAYPILLGPSSHTSGNTTTNGIYYDTGVKLNPSTNTISANVSGYAGHIVGGSKGSIPYQTGNNATTMLSIGTTGQVLKVNSSGVPAWMNEYTLPAATTEALGGIKVAKVGTSAVTLLTDGNRYYGVNIDSNNKAYVALPAFTTTTGTVTSVTLLAGNGISISSTAAITSSGSRTITNAGVIFTKISGNYLRVNTGGTTTDLTIPYAIKAAQLTTTLNTITAPTDDTSDNWITKGNSVHMYSVLGQLNNQPSQFGLLLNLAYGSSDVHQIWATQSNGNLYHRGGNHNEGWANNSAWRTILDSVNSSVSGDGGSTWGSSITIKINNVEKTLTIPSNPNTDAKVKQDITTSNTFKPVILGYNDISSTTSVTDQVYYSPSIYVNPSNGSLNLIGSGGLNLKSSTDSGNPPQIRFSRGTEIDNYTDWAIAGFGDGFQIRYKYSTESWTNVFKATSTNTYIYKPLSITGGLSLTGALTSTVATGTAPLSIASTTLVNNLNADMLDNLHAKDFYKKSDTIDANTLGGHPATDFFLKTELLEGFAIEDLTVEATVYISRTYRQEGSGLQLKTIVYRADGDGLFRPSESLSLLASFMLKAPIIKVISVTKVGNAGDYTAEEGSQFISVTFNGDTPPQFGADSFTFKILLSAFNNQLEIL